MLTEAQVRYISKRSRLNRAWPWVGSLSLAAFIGFCLYFSFRYPLLANPYHVIDLIKKGSLANSTLLLLAAICPVMVITCGFLLLAMFLFLFAVMHNERKLLKIIAAIMQNDDKRDT
ncbi:MAG: hypothetical protein AB1847_12195 [bacterium]